MNVALWAEIRRLAAMRSCQVEPFRGGCAVPERAWLQHSSWTSPRSAGFRAV
jgi:hypothetical protein